MRTARIFRHDRSDMAAPLSARRIAADALRLDHRFAGSRMLRALLCGEGNTIDREPNHSLDNDPLPTGEAG
jgi:hypothetical protein